MDLITINDLKKLIEYSKLIKAPVIYYDPTSEYLYSTDINISHIKRIKFKENFLINNEMIFNLNEMIAFVKEIEKYLSTFQDIEFYVNFNKLHFKQTDMIYISLYPYMKNQILDAIGKVKVTELNSSYINISEDEDFNKCINMKAADGLSMFIKNGYPISLFSGLLPINKNDSVSLYITDIDYYSFITRFNIQKKKCNDIDVFIRYMKL